MSFMGRQAKLAQAPAAAPPRGRAEPRAAPRGPAAWVERRATRGAALTLLALAGLGLLVVFLARPTLPNYDSYYTLLWGRDLAAGRLPDYAVFRTPTPHPLATLAAALMAPLGGLADRALVLLSLVSWVALLALLFRMTQVLLGTLVGLVAVGVLLTRTDLEFFALRAVVDVPFLALVFGAAVLELQRPRRGVAVIVVLVLAGLLRPEAWVLSSFYVLWASWGRGWGTFLRWSALAAVAPLGWALADWVVTGQPLYSLTSTREVAGQFKRQRSVGEAVLLVPDYVGANEKIVNVVAGGLGGLLALALLRARAALPLALVGVGMFVFLAIAAVGLSVIPRYLVIPSLVFNLCVAVALAGWTLARRGRLRAVAVGLALLSLALVAWRAPSYLKDARVLNSQAVFVRDQHRGLASLLADPEVTGLLRTCAPLTVPTHSAIPVIRFETGMGKEGIEASIQQERPPGRGLLLVGRTFNFEPTAARTTTGPSRSARKWWSNYPLSPFSYVAGNDRWQLWENCS
jgi:hypothetical protein